MQYLPQSILNNNSRIVLEMKHLISLILVFILVVTVVAQENGLLEISGQVTDWEKKEPLAGVTVNIKGTVAGTITSNEGSFSLKTKQKLPLTLVFTSIGFKPQEIQITSLGLKLQVALSTQTVLGNEVVVTASRVSESI